MGTEVADDSAPVPLNGDKEFTPEEREALRKMLEENVRIKWAARKVRLLIVALVPIVVGLTQLFDYIRAHWKA